MIRPLALALALALACAAPAPHAQSFEGTGHLPDGIWSYAQGVSADGRVVVGYSGTARCNSNHWEATRWEDGVLTGLGCLYNGPTAYSFAYGVSGDGRVVVGRAEEESEDGFGRSVAVRWAGDGPTILLEGIGYGVSADGTVIVGQTSGGGQFQAFRWQNGSTTILGAPAGPYSFALTASADGSVIVGWAGADERMRDGRAVRWVDGVGSLLDHPPGGVYSSAAGVSADGSVIVGGVRDASGGSTAYRWVDGVPVSLGGSGTAHAVSADGRVIVGLTTWPGGGDNRAFVWTEETGMRDLRAVLVNEYGLQHVAGWQLIAGMGVSDDGTVIVGQARNVIGAFEGWRAVLRRSLVVNDAGDEPNDPQSAEEERCDVDIAELGVQCTLRAAIEVARANDSEEPIEILFDLEGEGPHTIALTSPLPTIDRPIVLDGTSEPDFVAGTADAAPQPSVFVTGAAAVTRALVIAADSSRVAGLAFGGFTEAALDVVGGSGPHRVEASWIGVGPGAVPFGNHVGVRITSAGGVVGGDGPARRNVIAGNTVAGVQVAGDGAAGVRVVGNWIGVAPSGEAALPNAIGVDALGVPGLVVEGNTVLASATGIRLSGESGAPTTGARVEGNRIGLLPTNELPFDGPPSAGYGVVVQNATGTVVGGAAEATGRAPGNVIAGWIAGVLVLARSTGAPDGTRIAGNLIGTDTTGTEARPNGAGVWVYGGATDTRVGGWEVGERNVLSGSALPNGNGAGVVVASGDGTTTVGEPTGTVIAGNYVGTDVTGTEAIGNERWGVFVAPLPGVSAGGPADVVIGATAAMAPGAPAERRRNVIAHSGEANVFVDRAGAPAGGPPVQIVGNWIGLGADGEGGITQSTFGGATRVGVHVRGLARAVIGGAGEDGNTIGGQRIGVWMDAEGGAVVGNRIGTDPAGLERRANLIGVAVSGSSVAVGVAPDGKPLGNVISGNILAGESNGQTDGVGVLVASADIVEPYVERARGSVPSAFEAPGGAGRPRPASAAARGGAPPAEGAVVAHNLIGLTAAGDAAVVPTDEVHLSVGVWVSSGAEGTRVFANTVGGQFGGVLVGPPTGVETGEASPAGTRIAGNRIGLTVSGPDDAFVPNRAAGVGVAGAEDTVIGDGAVEGQGPNRIAGTGAEGSGLPPTALGAPGILIGHPEDAQPSDPTGPAAAVTLRRNLLWGNQGLAIARSTAAEGYGVTPNGPANTDGEASFDFPVLLQAVADGSGLAVIGTTNGPMAVEVFADRPCDASGHGEGRIYLGTVPSADGVFAGTVSAPPFADWRISATGTNANGTTSEFSACAALSEPADALALPVGPGQTPAVDGPDATVAVTSNPAARDAGTRADAGTLYLALHRSAPDSSGFSGSAVGADGTTVTPNAVQPQRHWSLRADGLGGITYRACLRYDGLYSLPVPGQLVIVRRASRGEPWTPHDATLEADGDEAYLCASGLTAFGEMAIGADSTVNPVAGEAGPGAEPETPVPAAFAVSAYPNPSSRAVTVVVAVPVAGVVRVEVYDALGRRVALLHDGLLGAGVHTPGLDAGALPAGVYVVRATGGGAAVTHRLTVIR